MKNAASMYKAVDRARKLILAGRTIPGAAFELAAAEHNVDLATVRTYVQRAESACAYAREQLARESNTRTVSGK